MNLSPMEKAIYEAMLENPERTWTIDDLVLIAYKQKKRPVHWYATLAAMMRTLCLKSVLLPVGVVRISQLGRGEKAEYTCEVRRGIGNG